METPQQKEQYRNFVHDIIIRRLRDRGLDENNTKDVIDLQKCVAREFDTLMEDCGFNPVLTLSTELKIVHFIGQTHRSTTLLTRARQHKANLGLSHALWLLKRQDKIPVEFRQFHLCFPGTVWSAYNNNCFVPQLFWNDDKWYASFYHLDGGSNNIALLRPHYERK